MSRGRSSRRNKKVITPSQMDKIYGDYYTPDWKPGSVSDRYRSGYDQIRWSGKGRRTEDVQTR